MATNLLTELMSEFRGDTLGRVASAIGESPAKTLAALSGALPALLGGLANRVATPEQASSLLSLMKQHDLDAGPFTDIGASVTTPDGIDTLIGTGRPLVESLFGTRAATMTEWAASLGGISRSSASTLLSLVLPILLGRIGKRVSTTGWTASSLMGLLGEQRSFLKDAPDGLASILSANDDATPTRFRFVRVPAEIATADDVLQEAPRRGSRWLWAIPILLLIPALLYFVGRGRQPRADTVAITGPAVDATRATPPEVPSPVATGGSAALGPLVDRSLPNNAQLRVPANGMESKLLAFIQDPGLAADQETWFSFDRLEFETDSARLSPTASEQLGNIAEILRAYPKVKVKIGGYTDNTADQAHNLELSQARASAAKDTIVAMGIDASRLSAEGYGDAHPIAGNSTAEGRQRNRRVDIRVTQK